MTNTNGGFARATRVENWALTRMASLKIGLAVLVWKMMLYKGWEFGVAPFSDKAF